MGKRFANWILSAPGRIAAVGLILTVLAGFGMTRIIVNNDLKDVMSKEAPSRVALSHLEQVFGSSETVVLKISHPDRTVFDPVFLTDLKKITKKLQRQKGISQVQSLATADRFERDEEGQLKIEKMIPGTTKTAEEAAAVRTSVLADKDVRGAFLTEDERSAAVYVDPKPSMPDEELLNSLRTTIADLLPGYKVDITGLPFIRAATNELIYSDLKALLPIVSAALIFLLWISLRNVTGVLITLMLVTLSILPAAGVMGLLGIPISPQTTTFPVLILAIVVGDAVHILSTYYQRIGLGVEKLKALKDVIEELSLPVFLTSATSAAGFISMLSSPLPQMGGLGVVVSVGIMWAWALSTFVLPSILVLLPAPKVQLKVSETKMDQLLEKLVSAATTHARWTSVVVAVLLLVVAAVGIPRIEREVSAEKIFPASHWVRQSATEIDAAFRSSSSVEIMVEGDVQDPVLMQKIANFSARASQIPQVGSADSMATVVSRIQETLTGTPGIPTDRDRLAETMLLYNMSGSPERYQRLVSTDGKELRITLRMPNLETEQLNSVIADIERIRDEELAGVTTIIAGSAIMVSELNRLVIVSAVQSIALALSLVFLIVAISFRSLSNGLDAMVPLVAAIVGVFGAMGLAGIPMTIASAIIIAIVIGVGVDFGIHFLARWDLFANVPPEDRLRETIHEVGRPILSNTIAVAGGLAVLAFSNFEPIRQLGLMAVFAMFASGFGALVLLPLLKTYRAHRKENSSEKTNLV